MAKYDSLRKTERNKEVADYADKNPELSQQEIGEHFEISASRVSRILKAARKVSQLSK